MEEVYHQNSDTTVRDIDNPITGSPTTQSELHISDHFAILTALSGHCNDYYVCQVLYTVLCQAKTKESYKIIHNNIIKCVILNLMPVNRKCTTGFIVEIKTYCLDTSI